MARTTLLHPAPTARTPRGRVGLVALASSLSLLLASCSNDPATTDHRPRATASLSSMADVAFATGMIGHHRQAVDMAQMVIDRGVTSEVKALATRIKAAQSPEITQLEGFLVELGAPTPDPVMGDMQHGSGNSMGMMDEAEMTRLESLSGKDLERAFLTDMIEHHTGAVRMSRTELATGAYAPATALAQHIIAAQTTEIAEMRRLLAAL